ncbi:phenylacetate-CoA oxygenase/reductase subunit PaaK [Microbacteriaceae bacterium K1510]|nr:phenylacetate-CoA oxygenase/reductase subunit PaaK [Microbacteriaceae bacterium K1510]
MAIEFHRLTVADVRRETPEAVSIAFAVPPELKDAYRFTPGQHLTLRREVNGAEVRRSYSICVSPDDNELRVAVKKVEGGLFSTLANETIRQGDAIDVMTPQGRFGVAVDPDAARTYVAIVAGSGITPIMSILRTVLTHEPKAHVVLIYGNRTTQSIIFRETLEDVKDRFMGRFTVHHVLSRERQEITLLDGRIDGVKLDTLLHTLPQDGIDHAFLCGPGGLIEDGKAALLRTGVPAERIHVEYFSTDGSPIATRPPYSADAQEANVDIVLNGSHHSIPVRGGESIVDAGLRAGLEMPYSCRGGMCCTCRAKVTNGEVRMDTNYSLEPWELEAGYVLTCQSHPVTAKVTLDYDQV